MVRYDPDHQSEDVEDRRGRRSGGVAGAPLQLLLNLLVLVGRRFGLMGVLVVLLLAGAGYALMGPGLAPTTAPPGAVDDENEAFVGFVLDDIQDTWSSRLRGYERARLVLFRQMTRTACGLGQSATGPFYCPADRQVYIDLSFFDALSHLGAPGDFARAYVIAHEVGHHIQNQAGLLGRAHGPDAVGADGNAVRVELQADCLAGVWASAADGRGLLEVGDLEEGLRAAGAIGDDRLQQRSEGQVRPESFTHGTSEQRMRWFQVGYREADPAACDTFSAREL
ncbi:MAG: neutral zinc metallopeptidase [Myxococcota bacterium]